MPTISPIPAVGFPTERSTDLSDLIAPPYDVLNETSKAALLDQNKHNIVAIDLPHLPAKTVGPDATYEQAGAMYREWLAQGVLVKRDKPALFAYQQTFTTAALGEVKRRGLFANVGVQQFGPDPAGRGGIHPHEQTFSGPKEDRLKLMRATQAQLSPIFGLYSDPQKVMVALLSEVIESGASATCSGRTADGVLHELWAVDDDGAIGKFREALEGRDVFIADGHHRYNTALNHRNELAAAAGGELASDHPANHCLFVLIAMQDPGMIVLPTHRVLGGMRGFSIEKLVEASRGQFLVTPFQGESLSDLEHALEGAARTMGGHAMGLYAPGDVTTMAILTTSSRDPLAELHPEKSDAWRGLDVAILQHLLVEQICQPTFTDGTDGAVKWKFPHDLKELREDTDGEAYQLGIIMRPPSLESVRLVSEAGELMPQKSTFFYPKLATGLVVNPLG